MEQGDQFGDRWHPERQCRITVDATPGPRGAERMTRDCTGEPFARQRAHVELNQAFGLEIA
jgi:hypothetical protein